MTGQSDSTKACTPEDQRLLLEVDNRVAVVRLNRPEARNAMTRRMRNDLCAMLRAADTDDKVSVVILTGTDPAFTGGVDLREVAAQEQAVIGTSKRQAQDPAVIGDGKRQAEDPAQACRDTSKPLICAVNGTCVTGGLEIALSCDFIVASDRARFADTHAKIGVIAAWGMTALLPRAVGKRMAKEMTATARFVEADEALRIGLVNHVVPHYQLLAHARALAGRVAEVATPATATTMSLYDDGDGKSFAESRAMEEVAMRNWKVDTEDMQRRGLGRGN
ncbi:enoyl-CoA hydratase [Candidatus Poriferisocius sp.]|uniref:enoyl-CoA hydratase n=1 Tax=Candidatus Poriferisocius sp. TaxID=3101276 RepID=UPI003B019177